MSDSSSEHFSDKVMCKIWERMASIYGHKWSSHLGTATDAHGLLTDSAKTWQKGLIRVKPDNLRSAFDALVLQNIDWPPSLPEFRRLCFSKNLSGVPTLDECVSILVMASARHGSLAHRFKLPLVLAIHQDDGLDKHALRMAKRTDVMRMIKPIYERLLLSGWPDWPAHAHEDQPAIAADAPVRTKSVGRSQLSAMRALL